jgi:hypothetical protein
MTESTRSRGSTARVVPNTSQLQLAPVLDALLTALQAEPPFRWMGVRKQSSESVLRVAPRLLIEAIEPHIARVAAEGYVIAERRVFGVDLPRVGSQRDDPKNDRRVQEIARAIEATVDRALGSLEAQDLLNTERDHAVLRTLLGSSGRPIPGVETDAPCERVELSVATDAGKRPRASAAVFLLEEAIDLEAARAELLHAVHVHRRGAGAAAALLGTLTTARFEEPEWQLRRFLDFLLGRGVARVHADVGIELLARVATVAEARPAIEGAAEFVEYVRRVRFLRETFDLDDPIVEDQYGIHRLADYVRTIRFVRHLPLALLHDEQQFERRGTDTVLRRITYRVRLNGTQPTSWGVSPIDEACSRFEATLSDGETPDARRTYHYLLPRMISLALLGPQGQELDAERFRAETDAWITRLQDPGDFAAPRRALLAAARTAIAGFDRARRCFVAILQRHHADLAAVWPSEEVRVHLAVRPTLFDPLGDATRPLREEDQRAPTDDFAEASLRRDLFWLRNLHVSTEGQRDRDEHGDALSGVMRVVCRLSLVHLHEPKPASRMRLRRDLPGRLLQVILADLPPDEDKIDHLAAVALPRRIVVGLKGDLLNHPPRSKSFQDEHLRRREREDGIRWAMVTLVTHLTVRAVLMKIRAQDRDLSLPPPHAVILRAHRTDGREPKRDWSFSPGEALTALGRAIEQALGATSLVAGVTSQGIVLADPRRPGTTRLATADGQRFRVKAANWAMTSRWPLRIEEGGCVWPHGEEGQRVGLITVVSRPLHDGQDRHLVLGETCIAGADPRGGFTLTSGPRLSEIVEGDPAEAMVGCLRAERNRLQAAGCGLILLLTHRHGSYRIGRLREFERMESSALLDAMRRADGESVVLCPISYGVFSAVRLRTSVTNAARVFVIPDAGPRDRSDARGSDGGVAPDALIPFFSVATLKLVGTDDTSRPQSGIATYSLALSSGDARVRAETEHAVLSLASPWHGQVRDVLLATHFFVTEKELREGRESRDASGFMAVLAPHEAIDTTEAADVGEFTVQTTRGRSVRLSLAALLADVNRAVEPAR